MRFYRELFAIGTRCIMNLAEEGKIWRMKRNSEGVVEAVDAQIVLILCLGTYGFPPI